MIPMVEWGWVAGFIEGEGSMYHANKRPSLTAAQVEKEPIDRLQRLFGGVVRQRTMSNLIRGKKPRPIWIWRLDTRRSVQVMQTIYTLMSPKRKREIEESLEVWKASRHMRGRTWTTCHRGHDITGENGFLYRGHIKCMECICERARQRRAAFKAQGLRSDGKPRVRKEPKPMKSPRARRVVPTCWETMP